jgi:predicted GNAT family N-acyltransferase
MRRCSKLRARSQLQSVTHLDKAIINQSGIEVRRVTSPDDFDACLRLRHDVFTVEQGIDADLDNDGLDGDAIHYLANDSQNAPVGTARAVPKGKVAKIGRVAVLKNCRNRGIGCSIMQFAMADLIRSGFVEFVLGSQISAAPFYERLGFAREGYEFLDAGIPHIAMRYKVSSQESNT